MSNQTKTLLAILGAAILGGSSGTFSKIGLREIPPLSFAAWRFLLAAAMVFPLVKRDLLSLKKKELLKIVGVSLFSTVNILLFVYGIRLTGAVISQTIYSLVPITVAVISYFILGEIINWQKAVGILLGLTGATILVLWSVFNKASLVESHLGGNLLILLGAIIFSFYPVLSKKLQKDHSPLLLTAVFIMVTAVVHLGLAGIELVTHPGWWQGLSLMGVYSVFHLAVIGTVLFYLLYQHCIKYGSPVIGSMILYVQPVTAFFWANVFLGEKITLGFVGAALLVLSGAYLSTRTIKD